MALTRAKLEELIAAGEIEVGGGGVNPNILHNWDFRNPVNQRAAPNNDSSLGYKIDRWTRTQGTAILRYDSSGITLDNSNGTTNAYFIQIIESPEQYANETVTLSAEIKGYTGAPRVFVRGTNVYGSIIASSIGIISSIPITLPNDVGTQGLGVWWYLMPGEVMKLSRIKLEGGTLSTLNVTPPMSHAEELLKCQRFYESLPMIHYIANGTSMLVPLSLWKVHKRVIPTITFYSFSRVVGGVSSIGDSGSFYAVSSVNVPSTTGFRWAVAANNNLVSGSYYVGQLAVSADL